MSIRSTSCSCSFFVVRCSRHEERRTKNEELAHEIKTDVNVDAEGAGGAQQLGRQVSHAHKELLLRAREVDRHADAAGFHQAEKVLAVFLEKRERAFHLLIVFLAVADDDVES